MTERQVECANFIRSIEQWVEKRRLEIEQWKIEENDPTFGQF